MSTARACTWRFGTHTYQDDVARGHWAPGRGGNELGLYLLHSLHLFGTKVPFGFSRCLSIDAAETGRGDRMRRCRLSLRDDMLLSLGPALTGH